MLFSLRQTKLFWPLSEMHLSHNSRHTRNFLAALQRESSFGVKFKSVAFSASNSHASVHLRAIFWPKLKTFLQRTRVNLIVKRLNLPFYLRTNLVYFVGRQNCD